MGRVTEPERHLSAEDVVFLRRHAGVRPASPEELAALAARTAALDAFELTHSLTRPAVAALLGTSEHSVLGMTEAGELYAHTLAPDGQRWPSWQFADGHPLPHLAAVVAAIPAGSHPSGVRTVMTSPSPDLVAAVPLDHPVRPLISEIRRSPADWLSGGGSPMPVLALLAAFAGAM